VQARLGIKYLFTQAATNDFAFFATSHWGGNYSTLGDIATSVVRAVLRKPLNAFMESLKGRRAILKHVRWELRAAAEGLLYPQLL
jgi:hypothetical protein